jgi:TupA-like ATPgrasp
MGRRFLRFICRAVGVIAPSYATIVRDHYYSHGNIRLFVFPRTFNELIQYNKIFKRNDLITITSDKWRVRQYVKEKIGERYLVPLRTVVENPQSIDFNSLPDSFVVKANHGSGLNLFIAEKKAADPAKIHETLAAWLKIDFAAYHGEWAYRNIKRRILVEEMLVQDGENPNDYKFFVFNGRVRMIQLSQGRQTASYRKNLYDEQWRQLAVEYGAPCSAEPRQPPAQLRQMIELAEILGRDFDFARIDLYLVEGKIFFGEVTHYPNAGLARFRPREFDRVLGDVWRKGTPIPSAYYLPRADPSAVSRDLPGASSAIPTSSGGHSKAA